MTFNIRKYMAENYRPINLDVFEAKVRDLPPGEIKNAFIRQCAKHDPFIILRLIYPEYKWKWFHRHWMDTIFAAAANDEEEVLILAPRDHAKSTCLTTSITLWLLLNDSVEETRIAVISASKDKAGDFVNEIKTPLEDIAIQTIFGKSKSSKWGALALDHKRKKKSVRGNSVIACGTSSGQVVGRHCEMIIFDDSIDQSTVANESQRRKFKTWMAQSCEPVREPTGISIFIGTTYASEDYYQELIKNGIRWNGRSTCSFYSNHDTKEIMWPEKFTEKFLQEKIKKFGIANVSLQYFNDPSRYSGDIFRKEWFRYTNQTSKSGHIVFGIDVAYTFSERADFTAICVLNKVPSGELVVENVIQGRWSPREIMQKIAHLYNRWPARTIAIEDPQTLSKGKANKLFLYQELRQKNYPVKMVRPEHKDKGLRWIDNLQHLYENGIIIHREGLDQFEGQLLGAGAMKLDHDDMIDALDIAVTQFKVKKSPYSRSRLS